MPIYMQAGALHSKILCNAAIAAAVRQVTLLDFGSDHAHSYNALIEVIRRNLLLADWCDDAHHEVRD